MRAGHVRGTVQGGNCEREKTCQRCCNFSLSSHSFSSKIVLSVFFLPFRFISILSAGNCCCPFSRNDSNHATGKLVSIN